MMLTLNCSSFFFLGRNQSFSFEVFPCKNFLLDHLKILGAENKIQLIVSWSKK